LETFDAKRVADPIHRSIGLSDVEMRVIETPAFQRLRNIKHLGLAHLVFPGADFSRFSHSLGACHVMGRTLASLQHRYPTKVSQEDIQLYRLAALLHDIGHYPFSHAMEYAVKDYYTGLYTTSQTADTAPEPNLQDDQPFDHERAGKEVVIADQRVRDALISAGVIPDNIPAIFMHENVEHFTNLISSDLDADRVDYLLRTAHHTGLPYGNIDLDYLISQLRLDKDGNVCLTQKALRAADHFLLGRYFDYQQVAFHKTVAALELILKDVLKALLSDGYVECSAGWVKQAIINGDWCTFDDAAVWQKMHELAKATNDDVMRIKTNAILERRPPKLVWQSEFLGTSSGSSRNRFKTLNKLLTHSVNDFANHFGIDRTLWDIWTQDGLALTKIGGQLSVSRAMASVEDDMHRFEQALRIFEPTTGGSLPVVEMEQSLMNVLSVYAHYAVRLYVTLPPEHDSRREEIETYIGSQLES
jgi:uncharacterized protein